MHKFLLVLIYIFIIFLLSTIIKKINPDNKETVRKIIQSRQLDGQLKESSLTRAEIEIILRAFVSVWRRMRHRRLKYPSFNSR